MADKKDLRELFRLFLRLGLTAFGGPAAHIAMMQREVVDKRKWMDHAQFLDLIGATNLIPGPNSTEMAIHIGQERAGWRGLLVAGACFICPAVVITGVIAWLYQRYGQVPEVSAFIFGIKPAIVPVILAAAVPLAKRALKGSVLWVVAVTALAAGLSGTDEIYVMFGAGLVTLGWAAARARFLQGFVPLLLQAPAAVVSNARIFFSFLKVGAILYGSGYVLFAFLDSELVQKGLLSRKVLIDAIAVGQFTPGPVFSSVTFIGWQMGGWQSAALATLAIFLPSFVFVALSHPLVPRMRRSKLFSAFLDGVNAASVAIILTVCVDFGRATITDWRAVIIAVSSAVVVFVIPKVNSAFVIIGGALLGFLLGLFPIQGRPDTARLEKDLLRVEAKIPLKGVSGRIDHMAYDSAGHRIFVAALGNNTVEVIDLAAGARKRTISGLHEPQGVAYIPGLDRLVVANGGNGACVFYDGHTFAELGRVELGDDADNIRYEGGKIYVGYGGGGIAVIDPAAMQKTGDLPLKAHPESFQLGDSGQLFINVPDAGEIIAEKPYAEWPNSGASANFPMALDTHGKRLFVAYRHPARLKTIDTQTGAVTSTTPCVGDADDVFYDAASNTVMVSGGEGYLDVFRGGVMVNHLVTRKGARTGLWLAGEKKFVLAVPARGGEDAALWILTAVP